MLNFMKTANVSLRFLLELCVLGSLSYWGFQTGRVVLLKVAVGIGTPLLVAIIWGFFGAPHSSMARSGFQHLVLEIMLFGLAIVALMATDRTALALTFGAIVLINRFLMFVWEQ